MQTITTLSHLRDTLRKARIDGKIIGFVPTMGALHEGHLALVRQARAECGVVVVSIFVNPTQFNNPEDLAKYPRDLDRDQMLCEGAGADIVFAPEASEMYPDDFKSEVIVKGSVAEVLEGYYRPGHFAGVTTVVLKLFNMVQADRAYFGQKDWQQLKVIEKMARDLNLPVTIVPCPTVREKDGLAMSSRNVRLSPEAREKAKVIPYLLDTAQDLLDTASTESKTDQGPVLRHWLLSLLQTNHPTITPDYIAVVDPDTLYDIDTITKTALVAIAVHVDGVRLIDNRVIVKY